MGLWRATLHSMAALLLSVVLQQLLQCPAVGGDRLEIALVGCGVKEAGNRVEFAQVNGQNLHAILRLWESGLRFLLLSTAYINSLGCG
jgi:hypothetical protein